jgi:hypothetical protein
LYISICLTVLAGCATRLSVEEASGESARLEFHVLDNQMPSPMLYWQESPWHIETALILKPPLQDCEQVRMYANRYPGLPVELGSDAVNIQPVQLATQAEELSTWEKMTESRCALLVTVGEIAEDDFIGISVSVPGKIIRRHGIGLQDDLAAKHRWWGMVPIAALFDVTHIPLYYAIGLIGGSSDDPVEPVTVIFQFPDGSRKAATLYSDEVKRLLQDNYPAVLSQPPFALKRVRTWARAAIVKLRVEFTEEAGGEQSHDEWIPDSLRLKMVAGHTGNWVYRLDTAAETSDDLTIGMGNASSVRFELLSDTDP